MIALVATTEADVEFVLAAESHADSSTFIIPRTRERHLQAIVDQDCAHRIIQDSDTGERLGFLMLFGLASRDRAIEFRRIVTVIQGRGIGRASVGAVKAYAFHALNAHRLWLDVKSKNARARHLYRSEGFVEEGVMRECILEDGGFESLVLMSMLRPEFEAGFSMVAGRT
jgi:RimJ/RimL family protein N-acetyltransferase